jgi:hypothetical protein
MGKSPEMISRSSSLRTLVKPVIEPIVRMLDELGISPDMITIVGGLGSIVGAKLIEFSDSLSPREMRITVKTAAVIITALSLSLDGIDGELARRQIREGKRTKSSYGAHLDNFSDRVQEAVMAALRANRADNEGRPVGRGSALSTMLTGPLPSIARQIAETKGRVVPEVGGDPIGFLGSHLGHVTIGLISSAIPEITIHGRRIPIQEILGSTVFIGNLALILQRLHIGYNPQSVQAREDVRQEGRDLLRTSVPLALSIAIATGLMSAMLQKRH